MKDEKYSTDFKKYNYIHVNRITPTVICAVLVVRIKCQIKVYV